MKSLGWMSMAALLTACASPYSRPPEPVPGRADAYRFSVSYDRYSSPKSVNNTALYVAEQLKTEHECDRYELDPMPARPGAGGETEFVVQLYC